MNAIPTPVATPPSKEELSARLDRVRALMANENLDFYVSFDPINIYYLTNFANYVHERPFILVIPRTGAPTMLVPLLETSHVKARARCDLIHAIYDEFPAPAGENWYDRYRALIGDTARVGIEPAMPVGIAERTPGRKVVTEIIEEVRLVKSDYEIRRNVHACGIVNFGHERLLQICRPGVAEGVLHGEVSKAMMSRILADVPDANVMVTKALVVVSPPSISHDPHHFPTFFTLMEDGGPHVSIVVAQVDGYGVELERTFFLGHVPDQARAPFDTMIRARRLAYDMARPGAILSQIDRAVRAVIADAGCADRILHRTGHGLGITGHEAPFVADGDTRTLAPGMLISIEPGIYVPGLGGFRHSDTVLITDDGCVALTRAPEDLDGLTIPL